MSSDNAPDRNADKERLARLLEQFRSAPGATAADRNQRGQLLDELQEAVGLSGKMATEKDITSRAEKLIRAAEQ